MQSISLYRTLLALLAFASTLAGLGHAQKLKVVSSIPDLADIVGEVGGERVDVISIARGKENTHNVSVRPSHLVAMSKADLFVQIGLSLESSFVPNLLLGCRNRAIQPGEPGFLNASVGWEALDVPAELSRAEGDVHPHGNPHMNLDPRAGRHIAKRVHAALVALDPGESAGYDARLSDYLTKLEAAEKRWAELGRSFNGKKVAVYHKEYDYLARLYGIEILGSIEPKPGIPPTPGHVAELTAKMKKAGVQVILSAPWSHNSTTMRLAEATGSTIVELPNLCGGIAGTESWIAMMDCMHNRLARAFGLEKLPPP